MPAWTTPEAQPSWAGYGSDAGPALKAAIAAVVAAGIANGSYCGDVYVSPRVYNLTGSTDSSQGGRAQVPVPTIVSTGMKFLLRVLCPAVVASPLPHWQQTSAQRAGAIFLSNLSSAYSGSLGSASVVGGPTTEQLSTTDGGFSNMLIYMDGIQFVSTAADLIHVALDLQCVAQMDIERIAFNGNIVPGSGVTMPSAGGVALRCPQMGNNDNQRIESCSIEGYTEGIIPGEHLVANRVACIYDQIGVSMRQGSDSIHINNLSTEDCTYHISTRNASFAGGHRAMLNVPTWDVEDGSGGLATTAHVDDSQNGLAGLLQYQNSAPSVGADPIVSGGTNVKVINRYVGTGKMATPPTLGGTGVAMPKLWRDSTYYFNGGTGVAFNVDGLATGVSAGAVRVPSGKVLTPTYTGAPTLAGVVLE